MKTTILQKIDAVEQSFRDAPALAFVRQPEHDRPHTFGGPLHGAAWLEVATGKTRLFFSDYNPNARRWTRVVP